MSRPARRLLAASLAAAGALAPLAAATAVAVPAVRPRPVAATASTMVAPAHGSPAQLPTGWVVVGTTGPGSRHDVVAVSPAGVRHRIAVVTGQVQVRDVSNDGRRVAFADYASHPVRVSVLTLATGRVTTFHISGTADVRFADAAGRELLLVDYLTSVRRVTDTGAPVSTYRGVPGYGIDGQGIVPAQGDQGTLLTDAKGSIVLANRAGAVARRYARPSGYLLCTPERTIGTSQFLASCHGTDGSTSQVFRYDIGSSVPHAETGWLPRAPHGYLRVFPSPAGTIVQLRTNTGDGRLVRVTGRRTVALPGTGYLLGVTGGSSYWWRGPVGGPWGIQRQDLRTNRVTTLFPTTMYGLTPVTVVLVDPRD